MYFFSSRSEFMSKNNRNVFQWGEGKAVFYVFARLVQAAVGVDKVDTKNCAWCQQKTSLKVDIKILLGGHVKVDKQF